MITNKSRKGELTTQQIVILIIVITSFVVILFLLFRLNLGKTTDKELCQNSVVMRGRSDLVKKTTPLNCRTSYICISADGSCEKMTNPDIERAKTKDEVYEILANEMTDCWWMFGEGKINYVEKGLFPDLYCSICSQVVFDDSLKEKIPEFSEGELNKRDFYDYLAKEKISDEDITYLEYLYEIKSLPEAKDFEKINLDDGTLLEVKDFEKINLDNRYYIIMGISSEISKVEWGVIGGVAGLLLAPILPGGIVVGAIVVAVAAAGGAEAGSLVAITVKGESGNEFLSPTIIEINSKEFETLKCKSIKTLA